MSWFVSVLLLALWLALWLGGWFGYRALVRQLGKL
jgi:hypothetical protein